MVAPGLPSFYLMMVSKVKIAAIDPDFQIEATASVPDGIRWQVPLQPDELFALCVN